MWYIYTLYIHPPIPQLSNLGGVTWSTSVSTNCSGVIIMASGAFKSLWLDEDRGLPSLY